VRDARNQMITVCFIENVDAMGVHTGDSYCTAPMLTIAPELQPRLQKYSYAIVAAIKVIGGANIQFAHDPKAGRVVVIEINPRTSRSSALASKATGFPIAFVSSLLAGGLTLDEIPYWRLGTLEKYAPWGDYVVVKFARWAFEKFPGAEDKLGTQMKAVGEVMSLGKTYKEALQKAIRSLEIGRFGLGFARDFHQQSLEELLDLLREPSSERQLTYRGQDLPDELLARAKQDGFADKYLAQLLLTPETRIREQRASAPPAWSNIPSPDCEYYRKCQKSFLPPPILTLFPRRGAISPRSAAYWHRPLPALHKAAPGWQVSPGGWR
jgi:carbamoyl-phosphate synthase large subunit